MKPKKWVLIPAILLVGGVAGWRAWFGRSDSSGTEIRVSGNIEVTDAEVSFKIPGRVAQRLVDEGQMVERGACLAVLDTAELEAEAAMRQAELAGAQTQLAELEAGSRPEEIEAAKARLAAAIADRDRLEHEFGSAQKLRAKTVISEEEFVNRKALFEAAAARMQEAEAQRKLVTAGPRREQIEQARARVEQAKAALTLTETRLRDAKLLAPLSGVVLSKNVEPGEYVAPGTPVVTLGELDKPWLRAYIDETDLGRVKLGQKVFVSTDTYPGKKYPGTVSFIAAQAEFTPKNVQTEKERVKLVYRIKVDLPNPHQELKPGMPADADILAGPSSSHGRD